MCIGAIGASVLAAGRGLLAEEHVIFCCTGGHASRALLTDTAADSA